MKLKVFVAYYKVVKGTGPCATAMSRPGHVSCNRSSKMQQQVKSGPNARVPVDIKRYLLEAL